MGEVSTVSFRLAVEILFYNAASPAIIYFLFLQLLLLQLLLIGIIR